MEVHITVFSGFPDPTFELSPDEEARLRDGLRGPPAPPLVGENDLGYRGFTVEELDGWDDVRVHRGLITFSRFDPAIDDVREEHRADVHGLEAWLLERARALGHGPLIERMTPRG